MRKIGIVFLAILLIIVVFLASTIVSPVLVIAEDAEEAGGVDMAAKFSITGFEWVYPGSCTRPNIA